MKRKLSITVEEKTIELVAKAIKEGKFRNKSNAFEYYFINTHTHTHSNTHI